VTWSARNAPSPCAPKKNPPAAQLPADAHDTEVASERPPFARAAMPGTFCALPQLPSTSLTTNASLTLPVVM